MIKLRKKKYLITLGVSAIVVLASMWMLNLPEYNPSTRAFSSSLDEKFVIGSIGNMAVAIPKSLARLVEYDDDPHFIDSPRKSALARTYGSKIRSFGFYAYLPGQEGNNNQLSAQDDFKQDAGSNLLNVGITSNSHLGPTAAMDVIISRQISGEYSAFKFEKIPATTYGLIGYKPVGNFKKNHNLTEAENIQDYNIYFHRKSTGHADLYIKCSNAERPATLCTMNYLIPEPMTSNVTVQFRRSNFSRWEDIRALTTNILLSFSVPNQNK